MNKSIKLIFILVTFFDTKSFSQVYETKWNDTTFFDLGECPRLEGVEILDCVILRKSVKDGIYKIYFIDNYSEDKPIRYLREEIQVVNGQINGVYKTYYSDGVLEKSGTIKYIENEHRYIKIGEWLYYDVQDKEPYKIKYRKVKYRLKDKKYLGYYYR